MSNWNPFLANISIFSIMTDSPIIVNSSDRGLNNNNNNDNNNNNNNNNNKQ